MNGFKNKECVLKNYVFLFALVISACGGGGDSSSSPPASFPVESAFDRLLTTSATFTASTNDGQATISQTFSPGVQGFFSSTSPISKTVNISTVVRRNGSVVSTDQSAIYFTSTPFSLVGVFGRENQSRQALPKVAPLGSSGEAYFSAGGPGTSATPVQYGTWSLENAGGGRAWLCLTNQFGPGLTISPGFFTTSINTYCFSIDGNGVPGGYRAVLSTNRRSTLSNPVVETTQFGF